MNRATLILGAAAVIGLAWWRGRGAGELEAELEELVGMNPRGQELALYLLEPNVRAFLETIRTGEGTLGPNGYRTMFGGDLFTNFADHPRIPNTRTLGGRLLTSTAAGAYQFLERTWDDIWPALELPDFSPESQDVAAIYLIRRRGALQDVREGRFEEAIAKCAKEWASLPGSPYGQPTISLDRAKSVYASAGGYFS